MRTAEYRGGGGVWAMSMYAKLMLLEAIMSMEFCKKIEIVKSICFSHISLHLSLNSTLFSEIISIFVPNMTGKVLPPIVNFGCSGGQGFEYILNEGGQVNEYAMSTGGEGGSKKAEKMRTY